MTGDATKAATTGIGERLREAISLKGKSLRAFSDDSGIPYRTLQDYVSDARLPGADALSRISGQGIDVNWLLLGPDRLTASFPKLPKAAHERAPWLADIRLAGEVSALAMRKVEEKIREAESSGRTVDEDRIILLMVRYQLLYHSALGQLARSGLTEHELRDVLKHLATLVPDHGHVHRDEGAKSSDRSSGTK